jgi:hypothetical protein
VVFLTKATWAAGTPSNAAARVRTPSMALSWPSDAAEPRSDCRSTAAVIAAATGVGGTPVWAWSR